MRIWKWKWSRKDEELNPAPKPVPKPAIPAVPKNPWRVALFGDIHSNIEALDAVLADARGQGVGRFVCTGDIVGYAANPSECLDVVRELNCPVVLGNHDFYAATDASLKDFTLNAMNAVIWTREHLSLEEKTWLQELPQTLDLESMKLETRNLKLVHSTIIDPMRWRYMMKTEKALPALQAQEPAIVFFGHTHVPSLYSYNPETEELQDHFPLREGVHELKEGWKHLVNPGSVGQPRDRDTRACYAIFDSRSRTVEIRRVDYAIEKTQEKIEKAELPYRNSDRLSMGR